MLYFELFKDIFRFVDLKDWFNFSICSKDFNLVFNEDSKLNLLRIIKEENPKLTFNDFCESDLLNDEVIEVVNSDQYKIKVLKSTLSQCGYFKLNIGKNNVLNINLSKEVFDIIYKFSIVKKKNDLNWFQNFVINVITNTPYNVKIALLDISEELNYPSFEYAMLEISTRILIEKFKKK